MTSSQTLTHRLDNDLPLLRAHGLLSGATEVASVEAPNADPHCNGQSVLVVTFARGQQLCYKPRPLAVDIHYQDYQAWLFANAVSMPYRKIKIVDRRNYGWMEFISHAVPTEQEQQELFFRFGVTLAGLHFLRAKDIHRHNVIITGAHPYPIDLEVFFHECELDFILDDSPKGKTWKFFGNSVLRIGILPSPLNAFQSERVEDQSVLGKAHLHRENINAAVAGFTQTFSFILKCKEQLAKHLEQFSRCRVRHLPRSTQWYQSLLHKRLSFSDPLWDANVSLVQLKDRLRRLRESEIDDLQRGDIPYFYTQPYCRDLWDSRGRLIGSYFKQSGLEMALDFLNNANPLDGERQAILIQQSLAAEPPSNRKSLETFYKTLSVAAR